jgi:hypothetical protein
MKIASRAPTTLLFLGVFCCRCIAIPAQSHAPDMSYIDNGAVKLGVDLNAGGAVTCLSKSGEDNNIINSWDWGRQVQMSYYAGPVPFTPDGKQPAKEWRGLGWNPIQAGDHFGHGSKVIEHRNDGKAIYVKCVPMQWPLDNVPLEGTFEIWYSLEGPAVRVRARLNNARPDTTQWPARTQEMPAVYTNGPFYRLMTYSGEKPFGGGELTRIEHSLGQDGVPWATWTATESWAALVNDDGFGVGVWNPACGRFSGGFAGKPGKGGAKDGPTGYISPNRQEILDHNIVHEYEYTLIVGGLKEIRAWVYEHAKRPVPPDYRFEKDRQGWWYHHAKDDGWPIEGELVVRPDGERASMIGPAEFWRAEEGPVIYVRAAFRGSEKEARVFWTAFGESKLRSVGFAVQADGEYRTYAVRLGDSSEYRGVITGVRLELMAKGGEGDWVKVKSVGFSGP